MDYRSDSTPDAASFCHAVRKFYFPQTAYITIGVLAAMVVMMNSLAMISVLKNFRRLRQRIYVFVISLAGVEILAGVVFLSDALSRFFNNQKHSVGNVPEGDGVIYSMSNEGEKFIRLRADDSDSISRELLEGLKTSVVLLSVLNIALVTFALYKRTTSMGRHHEDFKHVSAGLMSDPHSFLPAFDTMLRVLSVGGPAYTYGVQGNAAGRGSRSSSVKREDLSAPSRKSSSPSKQTNSSPQHSSFSREAGSDLLENGRDAAPWKSPPVVRMPADSKARKSIAQGKAEASKRNSGMTRLMSTGRRVSQAIRSRSTSGTQAYVGRHSYSVMSKPATACSLVWIWLLFTIICLIPVVLRRSSLANIVCPEACRSVELSEMTRISGSQWRNNVDDDKYTAMTLNQPTLLPDDVNATWDGRGAVKEPVMDPIATTVLISQPGTETFSEKRVEPEIRDVTTPDAKRAKFEAGKDSANRTSDNLIVQRNILYRSNKILDVGNCLPFGYRIYGPLTPSAQSLRRNPAYMTGDTPQEDSDLESTTEEKQLESCAPCSASFFPLSKSYAVFTATVVVITWLWLLVSASRLYYLRKHSTNVFVRCSALWRFMFMTALFYFFTLAPYVAWIILDYVMPSPSSLSPLWDIGAPVAHSQYGGAAPKGGLYTNEETQPAFDEAIAPTGGNIEFVFRFGDFGQVYTVYGIVATCFLLLNFAIAPTLYLVRLLGFRRIISAL